MSFPLSLLSNENFDRDFYAVIDRLKAQNALPYHSFIQSLPFFSFPVLSKEAQIKELFEATHNQNLFRAVLANIVSFPSEDSSESLCGYASNKNIMNFAQIALYKVLPCPDVDCQRCPREIATHNQYKDFEYECPFYHHERDRRRLVITTNSEEEFGYKANYYEEKRRHGDKDKYSQNYFESMFHPLYYKMFRCKRDYCEKSKFCPFFHNEEDKKAWDSFFVSFVRKDRVSYVKDKQKYYEAAQENEARLVKNDAMDNMKRGQQNDRHRQWPKYNRKQQQNDYAGHEDKHEKSRLFGNGKRGEESRKDEKNWDGSFDDAFCRSLGKSKDLVRQVVW